MWITVVGLCGLTAAWCGALASSRFAWLLERTRGVSARDPLTLGLVSVTLFTMAVLAALLPARRAMDMDPTTVPRTE